MKYREISLNALWKNNPALVQLLGLCPLLGVSNSVVNALGLGLATVAVLTMSNISVSLVRRQVPETIRLPAFVMIIAAFTTCIELLMQAYTYRLYQVLGIFIPIIVTNCVILGRAEAFARRNDVLASATDGLFTGLGFLAVLVLLGALRELVGSGALFSNMHLLFGEAARDWHWVLMADYQPVLVAVLPPGAFIFTGLLIALHRLLNLRIEKILEARRAPLPAAGAKRVRVTGEIR